MDDALGAVGPPVAVVEKLLGELLELPEEARAAHLASSSADPRLRIEVHSLLDHARAAQGFFARLRNRMRSLPAGIDPGPTSKPPPDPGASLPAGSAVGPYRIVEFVGAGGMGTVHRAYDHRLDRDVALKLLTPHLTADSAARDRFLAEARAAAALDHPNVCTIYEVGETADGDLFIAMALYQGETLRARLDRAPLTVEDALKVATQLARGLAAAHARGIVHQDVKPGNVLLLPDGTAKLVDFGLARMEESALGWSAIGGGTIPYMSPEQLTGRRADHRADLWSLGVVLYELLGGERPFAGERVVHEILHGTPPPLHELRPGTPPAVARIVGRLLQKNPTARYASAGELSRDLEALVSEGGAIGAPAVRWLRTAAVALLIAAIPGVAAWLATRPDPARAAAGAPLHSERVLVADFANRTPEPGLADAVSQALRVDLARSPTLQVAGAAAIAAALQRMTRPPGSRLDLELAREVAVREGIRAVIDGEVRMTGPAFTLSATIVEAASGEVVDGWRETAPDSSDIMSAIDRLSRAIRERLGESVASLRASDELYARTTSSLDALRAYSDANRRFFSGDYLRAAALYDEAVRLDTTFSAAYTMVAYALNRLGGSRARLLHAHTQAYRFREGLTPAERFAAEGNYYLYVLGDAPQAVEAFRGHVEAAKSAGDVVQYASLANALTRAGDLAAAEGVLREGTGVFPTALSQMNLVRVLYRLGKRDDAVAVIAQTDSLLPGHPVVQQTRALMAAANGDLAAADALARGIPNSAGVAGPRIVALVAAAQGRFGDAISGLGSVREALVAAGHIDAAIEATAAMARLERARGEASAGTSQVTDFLRLHPLERLDPLDRPHLLLASFYAGAGEPERARDFLAAYEGDTPETFRRTERWSYLRARAAVSLAEGDAAESLDDLLEATRIFPVLTRFDDDQMQIRERPELARAYERVGRPDSAIAVYERYLAATSLDRIELDAFELPDVLLRLAALYELSGKRAEAAGAYGRFADLWQGADAELQQRVVEARGKAEDLGP